MESLISKIKKRDSIFIFLIFFIIAAGIIFNVSIDADDELWNFQSAYKIYNGYKIYEDVNVIVTPLFFWCVQLIFSIFGANLFVFRISQCFLVAFLFLATYKILKKLQVSKPVSLLATLIILAEDFFILIRIGFNYNNMALLFFILGVYLLLNEKTQNNVYIQAIITILILLTKQNIGLYYALGYLVYVFAFKNPLKTKIKEAIKYCGILLIGAIIFIVYLIADNNLYNFLNYTAGGLSEFASENLSFDSSAIIYMVGIIAINIAISVYVLKKNICTNRQNRNIKTLLIFSIVLAISCYPILNWTHIIIGTYLMVINIIYILSIITKEFELTINKVIKIIDIVLVIIMVCTAIFGIYIEIKSISSDDYYYSWEDPFFGGRMSDEDFENIQKVIDYIESSDKNVVIVSYKAVLYMVPLGKNNGDFDLPFTGNLGIEGEDGLIRKVDNMENTQFLICKDENDSIYQESTQESTKVKEYIKSVKKCVGEIDDFYIYE